MSRLCFSIVLLVLLGTLVACTPGGKHISHVRGHEMSQGKRSERLSVWPSKTLKHVFRGLLGSVLRHGIRSYMPEIRVPMLHLKFPHIATKDLACRNKDPACIMKIQQAATKIPRASTKTPNASTKILHGATNIPHRATKILHVATKIP